MSFFGFDTSLPRDRKGQASSSDPFNPMADGGLEDDGPLGDDELDAKIRGLYAGAQEDVEIYDFGGEGYDGLGDMLEEEGDDFNADTFGGGDVGKDFDFGHGPSVPAQQQQQQVKPLQSKFASNFDDFWALPSLGKPAAPQPPIPQPQQPPSSAQQQYIPQQAPPPQRVGKTMEEVEAELRAARISQPPQPQQAPVTQPRKGMTLEEIEAQVRAQRPQEPQRPPQGAPSGPFGGMPPNLASMMQGQFAAPQQQQPSASRQERPGAEFPPLGAGGPVVPPTAAAAFQGQQGPMGGRPGTPGQGSMRTPPNPAAIAQAQAAMQAQQAEHFARMQALLKALPEPVQQRIIALPSHMHFDVLQGISQEFAVLLEPVTSEDDQVRKRAMDLAFKRLDSIDRVNKKRNTRDAKISAMGAYNNLMTVSDKEFITRIQISQIITADPYTDDFYAHIFGILRGKPGPNPGLMGAPPQGQMPSQQQQQPPKGPRKTQRMNAQQKAMLRMQQQVERLVADRKQRIEKATTGAANPNFEGALGKVGGNVAGNPKQALQISKGTDAAVNGSAADAVRKALEGVSLGGGAGVSDSTRPDGKRPPLTRHETLRILEKLYDTVLSLEQMRRSVEDAGDQQEQETLAATLWKELRVLEPLEISDPHPFISLLSTIKGKRLLPRALRHLSSEQTLTALTMIVASFDSLDVVRNASVLDDVSWLVPGAAPLSESALEKKREVEAQTECFSNTIVPSMLGLMATSPMKIIIGMLALFVERNDLVKIVRSRAGISLLTILVSRAEQLRHGSGAATGDGNGENAQASAEEQSQWAAIFQLLFERLVTSSGGLSNLFPSTRARQTLPFGFSYQLLNQSNLAGATLLQSTVDELDEPVWSLYAALAVSSSMEQQSILVQELREKILENVLEARSKKDDGSGAGERKLRLVNIFLNALGLDASQIQV